MCLAVTHLRLEASLMFIKDSSRELPIVCQNKQNNNLNSKSLKYAQRKEIKNQILPRIIIRGGQEKIVATNSPR